MEHFVELQSSGFPLASFFAHVLAGLDYNGVVVGGWGHFPACYEYTRNVYVANYNRGAACGWRQFPTRKYDTPGHNMACEK